MSPQSRRKMLTGMSGSLCAVLVAGCAASSGSLRGSIELLNFWSDPVFFTVAAEPAKHSDEQQPPNWTRHHVFPEQSVTLPDAIGSSEHRVSILVHEEADGYRRTKLAEREETFAPSSQRSTLHVHFDTHDNRELLFYR